MRKRLQDKLIQYFRWIPVVLLATVRVVAGTHSVADTCINPAPPIIIGSAKAVCRFDPVSLTATGCVGTVIWSNGDTGNTISVRPQQTTKYTAICRAQPGCISCFAEVWKVTVNTPNAPVVTSSATLICPGDPVSLTATGSSGTVRWTAQTNAGQAQPTGSILTQTLTQTTIYQATGEQNGCVGNPSLPISVAVGLPTKPIIFADKVTICAGQSVRLTAANCTGTLRWSDGGSAIVRDATPYQTTTYRAICQAGSCRSDSSEAVVVTVRPLSPQPTLTTTLTNGCPFQTADLTKAISGSLAANRSVHYSFHTGSLPNSPDVQSPGAVLAGTYYVFGRDSAGCYSQPVAVSVSISACPNAIAPCLSNPATVALRLDSLDSVKGIIRLTGKMGGSARQLSWQSSGGGLFTDSGVQARYLLSEADRQRGSVTFTGTTPDPDGAGSCAGASAQLLVVLTTTTSNGSPVSGSEPVAGNQLVQTEEGQSVFIPEGFSPNGDGINDRFVIQRLPVGMTVQMEIYNRSGAVVYQSNDYKNDWDGTANYGAKTGSAKEGLPDGTYFYQIRLSDGREFVRFVTLVR